MNAGPKAYFDEEDGQGRALRVYTRDDGKAAVQVEDRTGIGRVLASWVADPLTAPDLCAAICKAAGQEPPVMLARPDLEAMAGKDGAVRLGHLALYRTTDGEVAFAVHPPGVVTGRAAVLTAAQARQAAAVAVALADLKDEPDPAEVDSLAMAVHGARCEGGDGCEWAPTIDDRNTARAALKWMREREASRG